MGYATVIGDGWPSSSITSQLNQRFESVARKIRVYYAAMGETASGSFGQASLDGIHAILRIGVMPEKLRERMGQMMQEAGIRLHIDAKGSYILADDLDGSELSRLAQIIADETKKHTNHTVDTYAPITAMAAEFEKTAQHQGPKATLTLLRDLISRVSHELPHGAADKLEQKISAIEHAAAKVESLKFIADFGPDAISWTPKGELKVRIASAADAAAVRREGLDQKAQDSIRNLDDGAMSDRKIVFEGDSIYVVATGEGAAAAANLLSAEFAARGERPFRGSISAPKQHARG